MVGPRSARFHNRRSANQKAVSAPPTNSPPIGSARRLTPYRRPRLTLSAIARDPRSTIALTTAMIDSRSSVRHLSLARCNPDGSGLSVEPNRDPLARIADRMPSSTAREVAKASRARTAHRQCQPHGQARYGLLPSLERATRLPDGSAFGCLTCRLGRNDLGANLRCERVSVTARGGDTDENNNSTGLVLYLDLVPRPLDG